MNNHDTQHPRPLGYWLRTVDALLNREFATAFEAEDASRRDWRLLNALSGDVEIPGLAERLARKGRRLDGLVERGWIVRDEDGAWTLTDEGRAAKERLGAIVDGIRARVSGAVSPEDFATTLASLEAIARELGWDESTPLPRRGRFGFGPRGRGFDPGFRPAFGRGFAPEEQEEAQDALRHGFGPGFHRGHGFHAHHEGFGPGAHGCHGEHPGHGRRGHGRGGRHAERAFERGFDAGFARGREDRTA